MRELAIPVVAALAMVAGSPAAAQHTITFIPPALPSASYDVAAGLQPIRMGLADSVRAPRPTYWLEGGLTGTAIMGFLGAAVGAGFCGSEAPEPVGKCLAAGVLGFAIAGFGLGFPVGALIGGAFPKGPSREEGAENAQRTDQPHREADPVLRLLEPARRR
jgi:hypothetical protein